uniref:START domain-containing protein n=1 Tax=Heterorhabditis bacteriophora TaxID=37862 RepID=A0A1I7XH18_HETBA
MYESVFHAMGLQLYQDINCMWRLELYVNTVFDLHSRSRKTDWHLSDLFGRKAVGLCNVAKSSHVIVHIDTEDQTLEPTPLEILRAPNMSYALYKLTMNNSLPSFSISAYYNEHPEHMPKKDEGIIRLVRKLVYF